MWVKRDIVAVMMDIVGLWTLYLLWMNDVSLSCRLGGGG